MSYELQDGKYVLSDDERKQHIRYYLRDLLPNPISEEVCNSSVFPKLTNIDFKSNLLFISSEDWYRPIFAYGLLSLNKRHSYIVMNAYRLLEIYLGNDMYYKSLFQINHDILLLFLGYDEFENKRQEDIIKQVVQVRNAENKFTWLFFKGNRSSLMSKYPTLDKSFTTIVMEKESKSRREVL